MKNKSKFLSLLALSTLLGGWAFPKTDVKANNKVTPDPVSLVVTSAEVTIKQNEQFDVNTLLVSGRYDTLDYSIIDTSTPGTKTVTFIAKQGLETIKLTKNVVVRDGIAPEILGEDRVELRYDSDFVIESAYDVIDNIDEGLTVTLEGEVDRTTAGEYEVVLKAVDSSNNESSKTITVAVAEDPEVVARNARNEEYAALLVDAQYVNEALLANTSVAEVENMYWAVADAATQDSDHVASLQSLQSELSAKLDRVTEYYAPAPVQEAPAPVQQAPAQQQTQTVSTPVVGNTVSYSTSNTYGAGWCTWWVADQRAAYGMPIPNNWGNAISWLGSAQAQGYSTGYAPVVGAIAYFPGMNHVAMVEAVHGDGTITISEMGWNFQAWNLNRRIIPASAAAYIY